MGRNKWDFAQHTLQFLLILGLGGWVRTEHHPSKLQGPASEQSLPPLQPVGRKGILYMHLLKFRHQGKMPCWLKRELRQQQLSDLGQMMPCSMWPWELLAAAHPLAALLEAPAPGQAVP